MLAEDQSKVTRNGCGFKELVDLVLISCQVRAVFCPPTWFSSPCGTVFSNTASSSFAVTPVTCGFFPLPLQLSPQKDAVCGAASSWSKGNQGLRQRALAPVCAELHSVTQGHKHACFGCVSVPDRCREHSRDASRGNARARLRPALVVRLLGGGGWGAAPAPAVTPLPALLLRYQSALGKCICCFVPESPSASRGIATW